MRHATTPIRSCASPTARSTGRRRMAVMRSASTARSSWKTSRSNSEAVDCSGTRRSPASVRSPARSTRRTTPRCSTRSAWRVLRPDSPKRWAGRQGRVAALRETALIHDVGKIGVPLEVLLKPGALTPDEYDVVKTHALLGSPDRKRGTERRADRLAPRASRELRRERLSGRARRGGHPRWRTHPLARRQLGRHDERPHLLARDGRDGGDHRVRARARAPSSARKSWRC